MEMQFTYKCKDPDVSWVTVNVNNTSTLESLRRKFKIWDLSPLHWYTNQIDIFYQLENRVDTYYANSNRIYKMYLTPEYLLIIRDMELPITVLKWYLSERNSNSRLLKLIGVYTSMKEISMLKLFGSYKYVYSVRFEDKYYAFDFPFFIPTHNVEKLQQPNKYLKN